MTQKSKHTPGPWRSMNTVEDDVTEFSGPYVDILAGSFAARQPAIAAGDSKEETLANAHLIAAAPELYEALLDTVVSLRCLGTDENNDTCGVTFTCYNCRQVSKIKSILAKAEGK